MSREENHKIQVFHYNLIIYMLMNAIIACNEDNTSWCIYIISMHIASAKAAALMHEAFVPENHGYVGIILSSYR